jgi:hypothetical protein
MPVTISGTTGFSSTGLELVSKVQWSTNTSSVTFTHDPTKYEQYLVTYWVDMNPSWGNCYLRFNNASGVISGANYYTTSSYQTSSTATTPVSSNAQGGNTQTGIWLVGNGVDFDASGMCLVSIPNTSVNYAAVRNQSMLIRRVSGDPNTYLEQSSGSYMGAYANTITGFTIFGIGGASRNGVISVQGIKK